jgi:hypothetical protein
MEQSIENISFVRVDSDTLDKLIKKDEELPSVLSKEDEEILKPLHHLQENLRRHKQELVCHTYVKQYAAICRSQTSVVVLQTQTCYPLF